MRLAEQGVSIYWRVRGWLLWWAPWSVSVGKGNAVGVLATWMCVFFAGESKFVKVLLLLSWFVWFPMKSPWALVSFSQKSPGLLNLGACCWDSCLSSLYPEPPLQFFLMWFWDDAWRQYVVAISPAIVGHKTQPVLTSLRRGYNSIECMLRSSQWIERAHTHQYGHDKV